MDPASDPKDRFDRSFGQGTAARPLVCKWYVGRGSWPAAGFTDPFVRVYRLRYTLRPNSYRNGPFVVKPGRSHSRPNRTTVLVSREKRRFGFILGPYQWTFCNDRAAKQTARAEGRRLRCPINGRGYNTEKALPTSRGSIISRSANRIGCLVGLEFPGKIFTASC